MWLDRIAEFFETRGDELVPIMDAWGCREGWVQGELFRFFRIAGHENFHVNRELANVKFDLWSDCLEAPMVGEMKLIGTTYQPKCITGGARKPIQQRLNEPIGPNDRDLNLGSWGLILDYFRLIDTKLPANYERLLVLVADLGDGGSELMARVLRSIEFLGARREVRFGRGLVRLWSLAHHEDD